LKKHEKTFNTLVLKSENYGKFGKYRRTSEDNMTLNICEEEFKYVQWLDVSQNKTCCGITMMTIAT
jgi:hypothetical protein